MKNYGKKKKKKNKKIKKTLQWRKKEKFVCICVCVWKVISCIQEIRRHCGIGEMKLKE